MQRAQEAVLEMVGGLEAVQSALASKPSFQGLNLQLFPKAPKEADGSYVVHDAEDCLSVPIMGDRSDGYSTASRSYYAMR